MRSNKRKDLAVEPGTTGLPSSNETSYLRQGNDGMAVPSMQRGGSNKWGANDKGIGESPKGRGKSRTNGVSRIEKSKG